MLTTEAYDKIVCVELPDSDTNTYLYSLVTTYMMYGPCGDLNSNCPCTKSKGYCKFNYLKEFANYTSKGKNSYLIYRRRNTRKRVKIRKHFLDNSWVVPYNPYLLRKFDCHINVEVCFDIKVVKYICKGHDKIAFFIHADGPTIEIDEIKEYQSTRLVSPPRRLGVYLVFLLVR